MHSLVTQIIHNELGIVPCSCLLHDRKNGAPPHSQIRTIGYTLYTTNIELTAAVRGNRHKMQPRQDSHRHSEVAGCIDVSPTLKVRALTHRQHKTICKPKAIHRNRIIYMHRYIHTPSDSIVLHASVHVAPWAPKNANKLQRTIKFRRGIVPY